VPRCGGKRYPWLLPRGVRTWALRFTLLAVECVLTVSVALRFPAFTSTTFAATRRTCCCARANITADAEPLRLVYFCRRAVWTYLPGWLVAARFPGAVALAAIRRTALRLYRVPAATRVPFRLAWRVTISPHHHAAAAAHALRFLRGVRTQFAGPAFVPPPTVAPHYTFTGTCRSCHHMWLAGFLLLRATLPAEASANDARRFLRCRWITAHLFYRHRIYLLDGVTAERSATVNRSGTAVTSPTCYQHSRLLPPHACLAELAAPPLPEPAIACYLPCFCVTGRYVPYRH
jgi:hypothetical protein